MNLTERICTLAWLRLRTLTVLLIVAAAFAMFYVLTILRLRDDGLRVRMQAYADVLTLRASPGESLPLKVRALIRKYEEKGFRFYRPIHVGSDYLDPTTETTDAPAVVPSSIEALASSTAPSHAFTSNARQVLEALKQWGPKPEVRTSWFSRFSAPDYAFKGIDFGLPSGDLSDLRQEAAQFLANRDIFGSESGQTTRTFRQAPSAVRLMPWRLLRFADERRYNLNSQLPLAFGTLLLACGFLLQFRLVDHDKERFKREKILAYKDESKWVPIWTEPRHKSAGSVRMLKSRWLPFGLVGGLALALLIEILQTPVQRFEWIINLPLMAGTGLVFPIVWACLADLSKMSFNQDLRRYSQGFRTRAIRPLLFGILVLAVCCSWGLLYSLLELPGDQWPRALIQAAACSFSLFFLGVLLWRLDSEVRKISLSPEPVTDPNEATKNIPETNIIAEFFPGLDERAREAMLLALLPLPVLIQPFFG